MPIVNRDLDVSEQKFSSSQSFFGSKDGTTLAVWGSGETLLIYNVPFPASLKALNAAAYGVSGTVTGELKVNRFIAGSGVTLITGLAATLSMPAFGVSGSLNASLVASGSTLLNLLPGDQVVMIVGGGGAVARGTVSVVVQAIQDIVAHYGSSS